jgi:hypothetical protein
MAAQVHVSRHGRTGAARERHELVDVVRFSRPGDARHHLTADNVMLPQIRR